METNEQIDKPLPLAGQEFSFKILRVGFPGILSMYDEEWNKIIDILVSLGATVREKSLNALIEDDSHYAKVS